MTQLGENHDITLDVSRRIYEAARCFLRLKLSFSGISSRLKFTTLTGACSGEFI